MHDPCVAVDLAADPVARARLLRRAHEVVLSGRGTPAVLRDLIVESWRRCMAGGVGPERPAPLVLGAEEAAARLAAHPLAELLPTIRATIDPVAAEARHLMAISDADGLLLYAEGHPSMLQAAVQPGFLPGHLCSESALGTNAIGTSLALDHPVQIFSAEHFSRLLHGWSSAAAPIHDPLTGDVLGAIGLSASLRTAHPHSLSLVMAVARMAEAELERAAVRREARWRERYVQLIARTSRCPSALVDPRGVVLTSSPRGWAGAQMHLVPGRGPADVGDGVQVVAEPLAGGAHVVWRVPATARSTPRPALELQLLGMPKAVARVDGDRVELGLRHSELVALLAFAQGGIDGPELARGLYGPGARLVTLRAEITRLRGALGVVVAQHPYRLLADVRADAVDVAELLRCGDIDAARARCTGQLLPVSRAPGIVAARRYIEARLRNPRATVAGELPELRPRAMLSPAGGS